MMVSFLFLAGGIGCESEIHDVTNCYKNSIVHAVLGYLTYRSGLDFLYSTCTYLQMQHSTCRIWGQGLDHDENASMKMMEEINMFLNLTHMSKMVVITDVT